MGGRGGRTRKNELGRSAVFGFVPFWATGIHIQLFEGKWRDGPFAAGGTHMDVYLVGCVSSLVWQV